MPATQSHDPPRMTIRLDMGGTFRLGPGKVRLLELIGEHGSISAAGRGVGGAALSPLGAEVIRLYRGIEDVSCQATFAMLQRLAEIARTG